MRLSTVIELLLILLLVAFAAYGRVIERDEVNHRSIRAADTSRQSNIGLSTMSLKQATDSVNRYCTCNENICNCCRDFHIPLVQLKGPGCASLQYLQGDNLAVQLSFGENILTSTIVSGKSPKPVCVPLPGGFTKFCGRIYSIQRDAKNHFKACLGLELQSSTELEASLRVSCFRFGPDGLKLRPAEPLPVVEAEASEEEDDDDFFGLGSDDDDDDDEEEEEDTPVANSVSDSPSATGGEEDEEEDEDEDEDVLGLGALLDIITGEDETTTKKPKGTTAAPLLQFTIPLLTRPTSSPLESYEVSTSGNDLPIENDSGETSEEYGQESLSNSEESNTESLVDDEANEFSVTEPTVSDVQQDDLEEAVTQASNKIAYYAKPDKIPTKKVTAAESSKKKPSITSSSINAIENVIKKKKPVKKPIKEEEEDDEDDILGDDDLDDDDEEEELLEDEDDDDEDKNEGDEDDEEEHENADEDEDEKAEEIDDLDDDEEEDAMISALVYDEKEEGKKDKDAKNPESSADDEESDYGLGLSSLLARRHARSARPSKVTRL